MNPKPRIPTWIWLGLGACCGGLFIGASVLGRDGSCLDDVVDAVVPGFALDDDIDVLRECGEGLEEVVPVDAACSCRDFTAPGVWGLGWGRVFHVDLDDAVAEEFECVCGVPHVVEDHVGGVEVDPDGGHAWGCEHFEERLGAFLSGFEREGDVVVSEDVGDGFDPVGDRGVLACVVFWDESGVERDEFGSELVGDLCGVACSLLVCFPVLVWSEASGVFDGFEGGVVLSDGGHHCGADGEVGIGECLGE